MHILHTISRNKRIIFLLIVTGLLLPAACKKNPYSTHKLSNTLVVLAEMTAGDSVKIPIGKSTLIENNNTVSFGTVNNAIVHLQDTLGHSWLIPLNTTPEFSGGATSVYSNSQILQPNTTYTIEVSDPELGTAKASTHIPPAFVITEVDTLREIYNDQEMLTFHFTINDVPDTDNYYIIEALKQVTKIYRHFIYRNVTYNYDTPDGQALYNRIKNEQPPVPLLTDTIPTNNFIRLNLLTFDPNADNTLLNSTTGLFRRVFLQSSVFNNPLYSTSVSVITKNFISDSPQMKGKVLFMVKSVSRELYDYLFLYEKYKIDFGTFPSSQLSLPPGNITNGLGIFGGSFRCVLTYYFDTF